MSLVDELDRLTELRERGHISPAEYDQAKQQLLEASPPAGSAPHGGAPTPDGAYLLYRLVTSWLRRMAAAMAVVALLFAVVAGWSGLRYLDVNTQAEAIRDAAIAQGFGVRIPDPRPTIERGVLEAKATAYGALTAMTGVIALAALAGALFIRPPTSHAAAKDAAQPQLPTRSAHR
ncbi:MAG: SHOCT domain-containing protein [Actinomycetota bacterium]|nr:SHOCT domain-containing protein [Actinomycetota bacterium]